MQILFIDITDNSKQIYICKQLTKIKIAAAYWYSMLDTVDECTSAIVNYKDGAVIDRIRFQIN